MQQEKIISITGKPGLFKVVSQLRSGLAIENIITKKRTNILSTEQASALENISIFVLDRDVPLFEVFLNIAKKENFGQTINHKSSKQELITFMEDVLPDYDKDRVYASDIKKLVQWYNILQEAGYITPELLEEKISVKEKQNLD